MSGYFTGQERLETFPITGAPMRMGEVSNLMVPDYQVLRNLIKTNESEKAIAYLNAFHAQNTGMLSLLIDWCADQVKLYAELTNAEEEKRLRPLAISDYQLLIDKMSASYKSSEDKEVLRMMRSFITEASLETLSSGPVLNGLNERHKNLMEAIAAHKNDLALDLVERYHHYDLICHDSSVTFIYSYPTTVMNVKGEKLGIEIANGSMLRNPLWNGMWELTKVLTPLDLAAFLAEHLRFHFSGLNREGQTQVVEDEKKIRLVFDPCGSGGALRRRLGNEIATLQEKHQLGWNKCGEVNMYCSHCALNEKHSIDLFGYPKLVVEFQKDPEKPCGWTIYKNKDDVPSEVYERLGLKKK